MKNIQFFLDEEDNYCQSHQQPTSFDHEDPNFQHDPLEFLHDRPFHFYQDAKDILKSGSLDDVEKMILSMLIGDKSKLFRSDNYPINALPPLVKEMQDILDNVVLKAPTLNDYRKVYRFLKYPDDEKEWNIGDIYTPTHSLTTTMEDWEQDTNSFEITIKLEHTKAHCLYTFLPPSDPHYIEKQVNFERGTSFRVDDIKSFRTPVGVSKRYYLSEL